MGLLLMQHMHACLMHTRVRRQRTRTVDPVGSSRFLLWRAAPSAAISTGDACLDIAPTNGLAAELDLAAAAPTLTSTLALTIDTTQGKVTDAGGTLFAIPTTTVAQGAGYPSIRVLRVKSMNVASVSVGGSLPLAIVADGDVTISGLLDVSSKYFSGTTLQVGGPGALPTSAACTGKAGTGHGGGGGAGRAAIGSAGGSGGGAGAGAGGAMDAATLGTPLAGGCTGGVGAGAGSVFGGVGGGAIQITSRTSIALMGSAAIDAGGGGGQRPSGAVSGGGGGGSAGMIVLEAPSLSLLSGSSVIAARGGGGASSTTQNGAVQGENGHDGDAAPGNGKANGGTCAGDCAAGGAGGQVRWSTGVVIFDGSSAGAAGSAAGGGGGGATGYAVFKTGSGVATISAQVRAAGFLGPIATRNRTR